MVACNLFYKGNNVLPEVSHTLGDKKFEKDAVCSLRSEKLGRSYPWSAATKEAERLMFLNENAACFSKAKNSSRGFSLFSYCLKFTFPTSLYMHFLLETALQANQALE